jgi:gentisate 1,2-dioxygenase
VPSGEDGSREIRYTNPLNNGPVMPTIDCYAVRLESGQPTQRRRSTASTICHVVEGSGRSVIGDKTIDWSRNDIFTVPNWQWVSHTSHEDVSYLAQVTNRDMLRKIALLREETDSSI